MQMLDILNDIAQRMSALGYGQAYIGFYPTESPNTDHIVIVPVNISTETEADNKRLWLDYTVEVSIFTSNSNVFEKAKQAADLLEGAGYEVGNANYFQDQYTHQHQIDFVVQSYCFA